MCNARVILRLRAGGHHDISPPETSASRHGRCRAAGAIATRDRAELSLAAGADRRGVCRGRRRRHYGAVDRGVAFRSAGAILRGRGSTGAGGNIGTEAVVNAPPDGHTLLLATVPNAVNATLYEKLNFNFIRDIAPVAGIIRVAMITLVHPSVPAKTVPELIAYAKANPGKVNMASAGAGSAPHIAGELFNF